MNRLFAVATLSLSIFAVAGCSVTSATSDSTSNAEALDASVVQIVDTTAGKVLADAHGLSLYTFDHDTTSDSTCYNACATAWPPLLTTDEQALVAPFGVTTRHDGKKQVTQDGHPLYTYAGDEALGDINGDGLGHIWHLARPVTPPAPPAPPATPSH